MKQLQIYTLKGLRKFYQKLSNDPPTKSPICESNPDRVSDIIYNTINDHKPCMISRFGANELHCLISYIGIKENKRNPITYIKGDSKQWWWDKGNLEKMYTGAGFFPINERSLKMFCENMIEDLQAIDILGSWLENENYLLSTLNNPKFIARGKIDPFWANSPWTKALANKRVLVVHPFSETIENQYKKRKFLFTNPDILPDFELLTIKAIQSIGGNSNFDSWFDALNQMKKEMDKIDYDICLIGAGAYGMSLAAHSKRNGKKAIHVGGSLQLFFGIIGKRWENDPNVHGTDYPGLINEHWVRPSESETPNTASTVEDGCYW